MFHIIAAAAATFQQANYVTINCLFSYHLVCLFFAPSHSSKKNIVLKSSQSVFYDSPCLHSGSSPLPYFRLIKNFFYLSVFQGLEILFDFATGNKFYWKLHNRLKIDFFALHFFEFSSLEYVLNSFFILLSKKVFSSFVFFYLRWRVIDNCIRSIFASFHHSYTNDEKNICWGLATERN